MYASRIQALTNRPSHARVTRGEVRKAARRVSMAGPVHRGATTWHERALWEAEDPAAYLMAPATEFQGRLRHLARAAVLLALSASMTPALPALFGLA